VLSVRYPWGHFRTNCSRMRRRQRGHLRLGGGVKFVYILYGLVNRIEPRGISIFPGIGRKCGKVQMSGKSSDRSKSCS
jgi:hypothetical protein